MTGRSRERPVPLEDALKDETRTMDLRIGSTAFGGRGVARAESGEVVFVRGGVPGDLVRAQVGRKRRRHREGQVLELLEASPQRVPARCRHQDTCGGCPLQTLDYEAQLREKQAMVVEAWRRIGGFEDLVIEPILAAVEHFHYRNKMEFSFSDQRWLSERPAPGEEPGFGLGQHVPGIHSKVFDLEECWLPSERVAPILGEIRRYVREEGGGSEAVWHFVQQRGYWRFVVVREGKATGERMINLITAEGGDPRATALTARLLDAFPGEISTVVNTVHPGKGQVASGRLDAVLHGDGRLRERLGGLVFELEPAAFFQTNTRQAERLFDLVAEFAEPAPGSTLLDLYCGSGAIALWLAARVGRAIGVEALPEAVASAQRNARLNAVGNAEFLCGDVKDLLLAGRLPVPDLVVVDPPRVGLHPKVVAQLLALAAPRLVYVSCNPATQARDAALLAQGGYRLERLRPVDMFPHTTHVECVARFVR
jgi:23S rRNA (uracil1939-C5)-methyltransferase